MGGFLFAGGLLVPAAVTVLFFIAAVARRALHRSQPAVSGAPPARSAGSVATEELHALLYAGKRAQLEQRRIELVLRDDEQDGAPPRTGIDLDAGRAVIRPPRP